jgi:hypothetical protein
VIHTRPAVSQQGQKGRFREQTVRATITFN